MDQVLCVNSMAWVPRLVRAATGGRVASGWPPLALTLRSQLQNKRQDQGPPKGVSGVDA